DPQGNVELRNPAAAELSRRLQLDGELPARLHELIREVIEKGADYLPNDFQKVISLRPGGEDLHFLPRILLMHGREGRLFGVAAVLYNVTRFRLLDDAKSNLVATVSHEIKTPLTSIRMVLHLLLEKAVGPLNPKQLDLVAAARKDSERLLRILNDLLDLTRLEQGNTGLNRETTPADVLLRHAVEPLEELIKARGLQLHCETDPSLPAVSVDVQRIEHVFSNLITNAGKHSPKHGKIIVSASHGEDGGVRFSVRDQGPGIPPEFQNRVFERFFRVPGQTKSGVGLGLSICRELVIAHGGRIGYKPLPKGGSEFYFVLPEASEHPPG
ncbi:MAG TPA: ATP-binding protein, partial [Methylomirabilota bacterium]|nr:ATP-binding protein [Methylomirabilota bacterium]